MKVEPIDKEVIQFYEKLSHQVLFNINLDEL